MDDLRSLIHHGWMQILFEALDQAAHLGQVPAPTALYASFQVDVIAFLLLMFESFDQELGMIDQFLSGRLIASLIVFPPLFEIPGG